MTRQDFCLIAETIRTLPVSQSDGMTFGNPVREFIARRFADNLKRTNPRFDAERFIKACLFD